MKETREERKRREKDGKPQDAFSKARWGGVTAGYISGLQAVSEKRWGEFIDAVRVHTSYDPAVGSPVSDDADPRACIPSSGTPSSFFLINSLVNEVPVDIA